MEMRCFFFFFRWGVFSTEGDRGGIVSRGQVRRVDLVLEEEYSE